MVRKQLSAAIKVKGERGVVHIKAVKYGTRCHILGRLLLQISPVALSVCLSFYVLVTR